MITIWVNYYNESKYIPRWVDTINECERLGLPFRLHIIDDGSRIDPAIEYVDDSIQQLSLYRVLKDLGFNGHGCRNLAMQQTTTPWNILCDIDRAFPIKTLHDIAEMFKGGDNNALRGSYYVFRRSDRAFGNSNILSQYSLNDFIIHKDDFWMTGGYDEEYTGAHHGDRIFLSNLEQFIERRLLSYCFINYLRKGRVTIMRDDISHPIYDDENMVLYHPTTNPRGGPPDQVRALIDHRNKTRDFSSKKVVQFDWEQVF